MLAFLRKEAGAETMRGIVSDPSRHCLAHSINLCEVYYDFVRTSGEEAAHQSIQDLFFAGVEERDDIDMEFWQAAGQLKVHPGRISLADCFCIALAQRVGGEVVTADHHEFDSLVPLGFCSFRFIR